MPASPFDSALYGKLFDAGEVARLFSDSAEIRAMLLVEGALARAQGAAGVIPDTAAAAIHRAAMEVQIDPAGMAAATGANGVSVPALVTAFREAMQAPEHAQFIHWGATSQDIMDTGLMLRLRQALVLIETDLAACLTALAALAEAHADLPMPARTYGQHATPTGFGAIAVGWGAPLLGLLGELPDLRATCLPVSLSGAAGTAAALGPDAPGLRAALAEALGLTDPGRSWHTDRTPILRLAGWCLRVTLALGKLGEDATELVQSGIGEIALGGAGASSTMPQKQNPVAPSVLVALARAGAAQTSALHGAALPRHQRDGAAWFTEWLVLPQIVLAAGAAARTAHALTASLAPRPDAMAAALDTSGGFLMAEALSFALAARMPRPEAQAEVKRLCAEARETGAALQDLVTRDHPALDAPTLFDPAAQMGEAPAEARAFAAAVRAALP